MKKISSILLALLLVLAMAVPAFAAGPGTITINNASDGTAAAGRTFAAYKILDVTLAGDGITPAYSVPDSMKSFYESYFYPAPGDDFAGMSQALINDAVITKIEAMRLSAAEMELFAEAALEAAKTASITPETIPGATTTNVPYGYYVIEQTTPAPAGSRISAVMVDTTNPNAQITLKADTPKITKAIIEDSASLNSSDGAIGDTVNYRVATKVPDMTGFKHYYFVIKDTMSDGLTFDGADSVTVTMQDTSTTPPGAVATLVKGADGTSGDYHVIVNADGSFEIVFHNFIQHKTKRGQEIVVTYSATINTDAVIGVEGNPNEVTLVYSNNPSNEGTGDYPPEVDPPTGTTPPAKTKTFVTGIKLTKVGEDGVTTLTGAEFKIEGDALNTVLTTRGMFKVDGAGTYWKLKAGTYTTIDPSTSGIDTTLYDDPAVKYILTTETVAITKTTPINYTGIVGPDGILVFNGLGAGTYTITELTAPGGYNLLKEPITVTIGCTLPTDDPITDSSVCTWTCTVPATATVEAGVINITVQNVKGQELPSTGGMGTTLFIVGGIALVGVAVLLLFLRRKAQSK